MKLKPILLTAVFSISIVSLAYTQCITPVITSFSPLSGASGATITINGNNFDPTAPNNIVFFGAAKATVLTASSNELTVSVPIGATYNHITITGSVCGLTGYSPLYFNPVSVCPGSFSTSTVDARIDYTSADPSYGPYAVLFGDFDLDGKTDVLYPTAFGSTAGLVIARNQSVPGLVDLSSALIIVTGNVRNCAIADFNNDGKLDIVYIDNTSNRVNILRNISSGPGNFSFASPINLGTNSSPYQVATDDIDGDGKPDIAVSHFSSSNLAVFRNTSSAGLISFGAKQDFNSGGSAQYGVGLADIDGDNKVELISTLTSNNLSVLRNTSVTGTISFSSFQTFAGATGYRLAIGDLNADGKNDVVSANLSTLGVTAYRNTSVVGTVSFASSTVLNTSHQNYRVSISDLNADGRPDIVCCYNGSTVISCLLNTSTPSGAITVGSEINLNNTGCAYALGTADIDGDGNNDVITGDWCQNRKLNVFRNNVLGQIPVTNSVTPTSGLTCNSTITINYSAQCFGANPGNTYTAQLSDANGSFAVPINIGSVNSSTSGTIIGTIPACIATGTGYKVRVVGSDPATTGTVYGTPLSITCQTITPASIATSSINPTTYCAGATVNVGYTATGSFGVCGTNTFTAQLSDASGSFASAVNIGSVVSNTSGSITATIPGNTAPGTSYRIRVVSDQPQIAGTNNGTNITIGGVAPSIDCPDDLNVTAPLGECSANVNFSATGTGNITYSMAPGSSFPVGQTVVTVTSTTTCGSVSCMFTVTVSAPVPELNCPDNIIVSSSPNECSAIVNYTAPQTVQSCCPTPASISGYTLLGNYNGHRYFISNNGFTWSAAKAAAISLGGHMATIGSAGENNFISAHTNAMAWIGFTDEVAEGTWQWITNEAVTFTAWSGGEPNDAGGIEDHAVTNWGLGFWNDLVGTNSVQYILEFECDGSGSYTVNQIAGLPSGSQFPVGITTNTFSIADGNGAETTCNFTVTVVDNQPPVINCPGNITVNNDPGVCNAVVNYGSNEFYCTNNSGTSLVKINSATGAVTNIGSFGFSGTWALGFKPDGTAWTTVNWGQLASVNLTTGAATPIGVPFGFTAICLDANSSGQLYTIGWDANLYTVNTTTGALTLIGNTGLSGVMDIAFDASNKLWVINSSGNMYSVNTTTGAATLECSLSGGISTGSEMGLAISPSGIFYMTEWTSSPRLFSVNPVTGVTTLIGALAASYPHGGDFSPLGGGATAKDNCGTPTITYSIVPGSTFPNGTTTVIATATDASGNTATCSFTVTVNDEEPPTFTCPSNQNVNLNSSCQLVVPNLISGLTGSDNCGTVTFTQSPIAGAPLPSSHNQTHNLVITASDGNGNTQSCTVVLTAKDITPPVINCVENITRNNDAGICGAIVNYNSPANSDNCGCTAPTSLPGYTLLGTYSGHKYFLSTATATWTNAKAVANGLGGHLATINSSGEQIFLQNATNQIAWIGFTDEANEGTFVWVTGEPVTYTNWLLPYEPNNSGGNENYAVFNGHGTYWNDLSGNNSIWFIVEFECETNTGGVTVTQTGGLQSGSTFPVGTTINKFLATDAAGNTSTCSFTVTVTDNEKPTVTKGSIESCYKTVAAAEAAALAATTYSDNCTPNAQLVVSVATVGTCNAEITVTVTDAANNSRAVTYKPRIDNTAPVLSLTPASTTVNCQSVPSVPSVTANDNCDGSVNVTFSTSNTQGNDPTQSSYYNYTITRKWSATDGCGNTVEHVQTITVQDVTAPQITCPEDKLSVPFDFGQLYATIAIGTATATDNCADGNLTIAGTRSDNVAVTNQQYPLGTTTVSWSATDPSNNSSGCTQTISVRKRNTTVTYTGDKVDNKICVQYSDIINLKALLTDNEGSPVNNIGGRTITFQLLSGTTVLRSKTATTNASGIAMDTFKIEQAPGMYFVKTIFAGDSYFSGNTDQDDCEVKQEDAIVEYNGSQYFTTASSTTYTGSITVAASVNDINDGNDKRGDIRKAKATFRDGGPGGTVIGSANLPVGLVNPGVLTDGLSATTQNNITLNSNEASSGGKIFQVWVGASDHYTGADAGPTPVTLALPGQDFVTGGGHLVLTNSAGTYAGTPNSKMNFGFTMKWNKSGKNLQGNINIVFRKWQLYNNVWQWRVYQAKSNAINSMAVVEVGANGQPVTATNPAAFRKAIINTKANLKDVTDPLNNIDLGGNHNLTLDAWDHITANGGVSDKISITLMGATTNELLFSSSWSSNATQAQTITGGNINVRNSSGSGATTKNTNNISADMESKPGAENTEFSVKVYPNPSEYQFTLIVNTKLDEKISIRLYDALGRTLQMFTVRRSETIRFGEKLKQGIYFARVVQGNKTETVKLIKQ